MPSIDGQQGFGLTLLSSLEPVVTSLAAGQEVRSKCSSAVARTKVAQE